MKIFLSTTLTSDFLYFPIRGRLMFFVGIFKRVLLKRHRVRCFATTGNSEVSNCTESPSAQDFVQSNRHRDHPRRTAQTGRWPDSSKWRRLARNAFETSFASWRTSAASAQESFNNVIFARSGVCLQSTPAAAGTDQLHPPECNPTGAPSRLVVGTMGKGSCLIW